MNDFNKFWDILLYLDDIKEITQSAILYMTAAHPENFDKNEIMAHLSMIPKIINDTKQYIEEIFVELNS